MNFKRNADTDQLYQSTSIPLINFFSPRVLQALDSAVLLIGSYIPKVSALSTRHNHKRYRYSPLPLKRGNDHPAKRGGPWKVGVHVEAMTQCPWSWEFTDGGSRHGQSSARPLFPPFLSQWPRFLPVPTPPIPAPSSLPVVLSPPSALHDFYLGR